MATSEATSDWLSSIRARTESSWPASVRSFKPVSEAASSEWPVSTRARSESTWSDSRKSIEPDSKKSVRPRERTQFPSDVQDILESSLNTGEVSIDETFTEVTVRIGSLINASTFVVAQLPAGTSQPGERAYEVMSYLDYARFWEVWSSLFLLQSIVETKGWETLI